MGHRRGAPLASAATRLLLTMVAGAVGCVHTVEVTSNVPEAAVRVDGVALGKVKDGARFQERWSFGRIYDVEVKAPG